MKRVVLRAILLAVIVQASLLGALAAGESLRVKDTSGKWQEPLAHSDKKATVLIFTTVDCPVANSFAPEIKRICTDYEKRGVAFYLVHVDPDVTASKARKHAKEYGYTCAVLLDPKHALVTKTEATTTPEAAVFGADGKLAYRGRINNRYEDYGVKRQEATKHDLREALDAVLAGKAPAERFTKTVGCVIPPLREAEQP